MWSPEKALLEDYPSEEQLKGTNITSLLHWGKLLPYLQTFDLASKACEGQTLAAFHSDRLQPCPQTLN